MQRQTLNIPLKMMKRFCKDKSLWELFVFAVCIKRLRGSSAIHPDVPTVRKLMGCSYYKAERMIERAKKCPTLFKYYGQGNLLIARSFTHKRLVKTVVSKRRRTYVSYSEFCLKYTYQNNVIEKIKDGKKVEIETVSHIAVSRELRDKLLVHAIKARQLKNDLHCNVDGSAIISNSRSNRSTALHSKKLGRIMGCHHSTAIRHIKKMERTDNEERNRNENRFLTVIRNDFVPVINYRTGEVVAKDPALLKRRPFVRDVFLVVKDCNEYIIDSSNNDVFVNVIFNHSKRHRQNVKTKNVTFADSILEFHNH